MFFSGDRFVIGEFFKPCTEVVTREFFMLGTFIIPVFCGFPVLPHGHDKVFIIEEVWRLGGIVLDDRGVKGTELDETEDWR